MNVRIEDKCSGAGFDFNGTMGEIVNKCKEQIGEHCNTITCVWLGEHKIAEIMPVCSPLNKFPDWISESYKY